MLVYNEINAPVLTIHLDMVRMTPKKMEEYQLLIASKLGDDARAFIRKDRHCYDIVECWGSDIAARKQLIDKLREVDSK